MCNISCNCQDLWDIRVSKLRSSMDTFIKSHARTAKLDHLTQLEINSVRPLLPDTLDVIHDLQVKILRFIQWWINKDRDPYWQYSRTLMTFTGFGKSLLIEGVRVSSYSVGRDINVVWPISVLLRNLCFLCYFYAIFTWEYSKRFLGKRSKPMKVCGHPEIWTRDFLHKSLRC
jgi:hypothetical protein